MQEWSTTQFAARSNFQNNTLKPGCLFHGLKNS